MIDNENRIGAFTNSKISLLLQKGTGVKPFGAGALTYIKTRKAERRLGRSVDAGASTQAMVWGKIMEAFLYTQEKYFPMGSGYSLSNKETVTHPKYKFWAGSPDVLSAQAAGEIKCYYLEKYMEISEALINLKKGSITLDDFKNEFKEEYWQVVGNATIINKPQCVIFVYTPTLDELEDCILMLQETNFGEKLGLDPWQYRFMLEAKEREQLFKLPYIDPLKSDWPNFVKHEFQPPADDVIFLTKRVLEAEKLLS